MVWQTQKYTREQINAAGKALISTNADEGLSDSDLEIVNNWRACHSFPLNTIQIGLRQKAHIVDSKSLVAQRIKRLSSIELKLQRFPQMKLSQMQDIGGCRAVVAHTNRVQKIVQLYKKSRAKHKLIHVDDYIKEPPISGYRGVHLIYRYYSDQYRHYNDLKIEIQIRSSLQHVWATAVETVGTFTRQALKSSQGEQEWLRFFALMGTALAFRENSPPVPNTPTDKIALIKELHDYSQKLNVAQKLRAYGSALNIINEPGVKGAHYFLLHLDAAENKITVSGFKDTQLKQASDQYLAIEKSIVDKPGADAVLVSVNSLASLRRAYPNYYLDTTMFVNALTRELRT